MTDHYDVIIIGAGPGGSATGHYLAQGGLRVLLLDKATFPRDKTCGDGLTPRALRVLDDMGLLDGLQTQGQRLDRLEVFAPWGHSVAAQLPRVGAWHVYSLVVPRLVLDDTIRQRALASGAAFQGGMHVVQVEREGGGVVVKAERRGQANQFRGRMAVVATGASHKLLLTMGLLRHAPPIMLAARAYFEGMAAPPTMHLRFDGVPLPGYGWVFPLSATSANVGAGYFRAGWSARWMPDNPRQAFDHFIQTPPLRRMLDGARQVGPVKGYPLRVDFATAPTYGDHVLLVGEAAGLVNPLTGEGIDYALESGHLAASHLLAMFGAGDFSSARHAEYDHLLRARFQRLFVFCNRVRAICLNPPLLNLLVWAANRRPDLKLRLMHIVLGLRP
ncbi:MAG: geranylgeranyl reductase family protein [Anaerolineae bacterium]|nr:geranylgeranyl reductase family protein [Anaerolineae bacterium]